MLRYILPFISYFAGIISVCGQTASPLLPHQIEPPMRIPLLMSGNFGELRKNHFHSGIDLKTAGVTGQKVYSIDEGYISRISISPYGYGKALYIDHPSGITTVYGHLNRFTRKLDSLVKARQYAAESFGINLTFPAGELPVRRGELIAFSGNTGSSGGPHLHFEIRDTQTEEILNPLTCFRHQIKDTRTPDIKSLMIYPEGGIVNGSARKKQIPVTRRSDGTPRIEVPVTAWGKIGIGLKAYDYMDGTTNTYGIYSIELQVDSQTVFSFKSDRFSFGESRYLNSLIDYEEYRAKRSFFIKSYIDPGNRLRMCTAPANGPGILKIDREKEYRCTYILRDAYHNTTTLSFTILGVKQPLPPVPGKQQEQLGWDEAHTIRKNDMKLEIPAGALYNDLRFEYKQEKKEKGQPYYSDIYHIHRPGTPLHLYSELTVRIADDTLRNKSRYYLVKIDKEETPVTGKYDDGFYTVRIREFGKYAVRADLTPPSVVPVGAEKWVRNGVIRYRIRDEESGIRSYRGEIDGRFALFEEDGKSPVISYRLDKERLERGKKHELKLTVTDNCGNIKEVYTSFMW